MASTIPDWLEVANSCNSAYKQNGLGWILYGLVRAYKPLVCVELGVLEGYSTIFIAAALRDELIGSLDAYDLWEDYPYRHVTMKETQARLVAAGLAGYVALHHADAYHVPKTYDAGEIDFLHCDLSNDGDVVWCVANAFRPFMSKEGVMVFEGGSTDRDECDWMIEYGKTPINATLDRFTDWDYFVIDPYPSMTIMVPR